MVNVALPAIRDDLSGGLDGLQWVVNAYTIVFSGLMLSMGAITDKLGAKRVYIGSLNLFLAASAISATVSSLGTLIGLIQKNKNRGVVIMGEFVKVHIMHSGEVKADRALLFKELEVIPPVNQRGEEYQLRIPVSTYLIEHPKGRVVVDAGWHEDIRTKQKEHLGFVYGFVEGELPEGSSVKEQLTSKGLTPPDIDVVVVTHLDVDHISGLQLLNGAKKFMVSEPEWNSHAENKEKWYDGILFEPFALETIPYGPYKLGKDLFGDGLVYLVFTPGHTAGHLSILARVDQGWLLLASDVGPAEKSWIELILPGKTFNEEQALKSLQWVQQFSKRADCVVAIANHDPNVNPQSF